MLLWTCYDVNAFSFSVAQKPTFWAPFRYVFAQKRVLPKNWAPCITRSERELTSFLFSDLIGCSLLLRKIVFYSDFSLQKKWSNFLDVQKQL